MSDFDDIQEQTPRVAGPNDNRLAFCKIVMWLCPAWFFLSMIFALASMVGDRSKFSGGSFTCNIVGGTLIGYVLWIIWGEKRVELSAA